MKKDLEKILADKDLKTAFKKVTESCDEAILEILYNSDNAEDFEAIINGIAKDGRLEEVCNLIKRDTLRIVERIQSESNPIAYIQRRFKMEFSPAGKIYDWLLANSIVKRNR